MNCEEVRLLLADGPDQQSGDVRSHVAACEPCRELADDARVGLAAARRAVAGAGAAAVPPLDTDALLDRIGPADHRSLLPAARRLAALLLAAVGVLALSGTRLEAADGALRLSFALPGASHTATPPDTCDRAVLDALAADDPQSAVRRAIELGLVPVAAWLDERDARQTERLDELLAWVRDMHRNEIRALRAEVDLVRLELDASRNRLAALRGPPALPPATD